MQEKVELTLSVPRDIGSSITQIYLHKKRTWIEDFNVLWNKDIFYLQYF